MNNIAIKYSNSFSAVIDFRRQNPRAEIVKQIVASELKDPIWHSLEWQIGSFSSEATK